MSDSTILGSASCYEDLQYLLRLRADLLNVSRETIDDLAYFTDGYANKVLRAKPIRRISWELLPDLLRALGVKLLVAEDAKALQRTQLKGKKRIKRQVRNGTMLTPATYRFLMKIAAKGGMNSRKRMTKDRASEIGRKAIAARWANRAAGSI